MADDSRSTTPGPGKGSTTTTGSTTSTLTQVAKLEAAQFRKELGGLSRLVNNFNKLLTGKVVMDVREAGKNFEAFRKKFVHEINTISKVSLHASTKLGAQFVSAFDSMVKEPGKVVDEIKKLDKAIRVMKTDLNIEVGSEELEETQAQLDDLRSSLSSVASMVLEAPTIQLRESITESLEEISGHAVKLGVEVDPQFRKGMDGILKDQLKLEAKTVNVMRELQETMEGMEDAAEALKLAHKLEEEIVEDRNKLQDRVDKSLKRDMDATKRRQKADEMLTEQLDFMGKTKSMGDAPELKDFFAGIRKRREAGEIGPVMATSARAQALGVVGAQKFDLDKLSGPMGDFFGILSKSSGILAMWIGMFAMIGKLILGADKAVKDFNKTVMEGTAGFTELSDLSLMDDATSDADKVVGALARVRNEAKTLWNALHMSAEEMTKAVLTMQSAGATYDQILAGFSGNLQNAATVVQTYSLVTGQSIESIGGFIADMHDSLVMPFEDMEGVLAAVTHEMYASSLGADRFFSALKNITMQNRLYNASIKGTGAILETLGKSSQVAADDTMKMAEQLTQAVKGMSDAQRVGMAQMLEGYSKGIVKVLFERDLATKDTEIKEVEKDLRDAGVTITKAGVDLSSLPEDMDKSTEQLIHKLDNLKFERGEVSEYTKGGLELSEAMKYLSEASNMEMILTMMTKGRTDIPLKELAKKIGGVDPKIGEVVGLPPELYDMVKKYFSGAETDFRLSGDYISDAALTVDGLMDLVKDAATNFDDAASAAQRREEAAARTREARPMTDALTDFFGNIFFVISDTLSDIYRFIANKWEDFAPDISERDMRTSVADLDIALAQRAEAGAGVRAPLEEELIGLKKQEKKTGVKSARQVEVETLLANYKKAEDDAAKMIQEIKDREETRIREQREPSKEAFEGIKALTSSLSSGEGALTPEDVTGLEDAVSENVQRAEEANILATDYSPVMGGGGGLSGGMDMLRDIRASEGRELYGTVTDILNKLLEVAKGKMEKAPRGSSNWSKAEIEVSSLTKELAALGSMNVGEISEEYRRIAEGGGGGNETLRKLAARRGAISGEGVATFTELSGRSATMEAVRFGQEQLRMYDIASNQPEIFKEQYAGMGDPKAFTQSIENRLRASGKTAAQYFYINIQQGETAPYEIARALAKLEAEMAKGNG